MTSTTNSQLNSEPSILIKPKAVAQLDKAIGAYTKLVTKITQAYVDIAQLHEQEKDLINTLEAENIHYCEVMPRIHTSNIGCVSNEYAWIHFFLREAEQQGYLKANDYFAERR